MLFREVHQNYIGPILKLIQGPMDKRKMTILKTLITQYMLKYKELENMKLEK